MLSQLNEYVMNTGPNRQALKFHLKKFKMNEEFVLQVAIDTSAGMNPAAGELPYRSYGGSNQLQEL